MSVVSLALFKKHVRADDFADDDSYLEHLLNTAEDAVITATRRTERELTALNGNAAELSFDRGGKPRAAGARKWASISLTTPPSSTSAMPTPCRRIGACDRWAAMSTP